MNAVGGVCANLHIEDQRHVLEGGPAQLLGGLSDAGRSLLRVATFILGDIHQIEPKGVGVNEFDDGFYYTLGLVGSFGSGMVSA